MNHYYLSFFLSMLFSIQLSAQNLIANPSADGGDPTSNGWTNVVTGTDCYGSSGWGITGGHDGFPAVNTGTKMFFSGCGSIAGEIYQDVDVSGYAADIDASLADFTFEAYTQVYDQGSPDGTRLLVEYLNVDKSTILSTYDSGETNNINSWMLNSDTRTAPVGTRWIRVHLYSIANSGDAVDGYFDDISLTTGAALPIELKGLRVQSLQSNEVELKWTTVSETNNEYFLVEHSIDGKKWEAVHKVNGAGNSNQQVDYYFLDKTPFTGLSFYRLKQVDFNGQFSYSGIKSVQLKSERTVEVYPNPVSDYLNIDLGETEEVNLTLVNSIGQVVFTKIINQSGKSKIEMQGLEKGIYYLKINGFNYFQNEKIVVE